MKGAINLVGRFTDQVKFINRYAQTEYLAIRSVRSSHGMNAFET